MADKKISELNSAAAVYDADDFALVQDGDTKQVNASTVKAYVKDGLSKSDVGLGNVDNTSDANKPVSTATQTALDLKQDAASAATLTGTQTLTNKTISGSSNTLSNIGNSSLTNSSITINGNAVSLGGSTTVSAATTNTLTIGTGLSGTSFNGSSAVTIAIDSSVVTLTDAQTLTNKTLTSPAISGGTANNVAIGGTTPAAGAFTTLSSTGNTTLGNESADTLTINGTAVSIPNNLNFDSDTLFIDAANNQVGIGTSSPLVKCDVKGATNTHVGITASGAGESIILAYDDSGIRTPNLSYAAASHKFLINTTDSMRFTSKGLLVGYTSDSGLSGTGNAIFSGNVSVGATGVPYSLGKQLTVQVGNTGAVASSAAITCGAYSSSADSIYSIIESFGARYDSNPSFGGRHGAAYRRCDGTAIASGAGLGIYAFGGQWGTDTSFQSAKVLYSASIVGVAEGSFTSATAMPTGLSFCTGSTGNNIGTPNVGYGTERIRLKSTGQMRLVPLAADPAGAENGDMYYNSTSNTFRVYQAGAWKTITTA